MALVAVAFFLFAYTLRFSHWGFTAGFTFDDLMNLGRAIQFGWAEALTDTLLFAKPSHLYRPVGAIFYLAIDALAGPHPMAFRIVCHALLAGNALLAFQLFRLLSGRVAVAAIAVIPLVHHPGRQLFYVNSGYCYDLLCFAFTMGAIWVYVRGRQHGHELKGGRLLVLLALLILALGSKEVAVALPVVLLAFEAATPGPWTVRRVLPIVLTGAMVAIFLGGRVLASSGLTSITSYTPSFTGPIVAHRTIRFFAECSLLAGWGGLVLTALAWLPRDRAAVTGLTLALAAFAPVSVLDRSFEASYLASAGWSLAVSNLLVWLADRMAERSQVGKPVAALAFPAVAVWFWTQSSDRAIDPRDALREGCRIQQAAADLRALRLELRPPAQVLFMADPFPESRYSSTFLLTILYRGPAPGEVITADWAADGARDDPSRYAAVLTAEEGRIRRLR